MRTTLDVISTKPFGEVQDSAMKTSSVVGNSKHHTHYNITSDICPNPRQKVSQSIKIGVCFPRDPANVCPLAKYGIMHG